MSALAGIESALDAGPAAPQLLAMAEQILEAWLHARGETATQERSEGFRLLALHRQGCRGVPSFNACRETCREIAYHYNLLAQGDAAKERAMMTMLVRHLALFVYGKLEAERLGEFCCSSRPVRLKSDLEEERQEPKEEQHHA